jgi:hypothetical protein
MSTRAACWSCFVFVAAIACPLAGDVALAQSPGLLRYHGQVGQTHAYDVNIKADSDEETETFQGTISFVFQSVTEEQLKVTYQGGLARHTQPKSTGRGGGFGPSFGPPRGMMGPPRGLGGPFGPFATDPFTGTRHTTNQLVLTPRGRTLSMEGDSQLPYLLGNASLLIFEPLPEKAESSWKVDSGVSITEGEGRRPGPSFFSPFDRNEPERTTAGNEGATYAVERVQGALVSIKKTYRLKSPAVDKDDQDSELTGSGTWTFNRELGMPESLDFQQQMLIRQGNTTVTIPISIKYRRLSAEELNKMQADAQQRMAELQQKAAESKQKAEAPLDPATKQQLVASLSSGNLARILQGLRDLEQKSPKDTDAEIVAAIQPLLQHANRGVQDAAEKALAKWSPEYREKAEIDRAYRGPGFVSDSRRPVGESTPLFPGQIVAGHDTGAWYAAEILDVLPNGDVQLQFRGWGNRTKTLPRSKLQLAPPGVDQPNLTPEQLAALEGKSPVSAPGDSSGRGMRTWSDDSGSFTIEAQFLGCDADKVRLRRKDGREISVPLDRLSAADRQMIEKLRKQPRATNPFEP